MKPIFQVKVNNTISDSFIVRYLDIPHSSKQYHYHDEYELLYNIQNSGIRCIGDNIERYCNNDLVFIGNRIPHFWHSDDMYFSDEPDLRPKAVIVHFGKDLFTNALDSFPELADLKKLMERSGSGIHFRGIEARVIGEKMIQLTKISGWKRLILLIEILSLMSESNDGRLLSSTSFIENHQNVNEDKLNKIFNLLIEKHNQDISLEEAAYNVNMCVSSFCRYIRKHTNKTYSQLLNEIRIGFACKSLMFTENTISEIAFSSGYKNVPYFNRLFKKMKDITPNEYRQNHIKMMV